MQKKTTHFHKKEWASAQECFIPNIPDFKLSYLMSFLEKLISTTYEFAEFKAF